MDRPELAESLETLFRDCNDPALIDPDPLLVVRRYGTPADRELAGLVCSSIAVGRASLIVDACGAVLAPLGPAPAAALDGAAPEDLIGAFGAFRYRFFGGRDLFALFSAISALRRRYGSLEGAFRAGRKAAANSGGNASASSAGALVGMPGAARAGAHPYATIGGVGKISRRIREAAGPSLGLLEGAEGLVSALEVEASAALAAADEAGLFPESQRGVPMAANLLSAPSGGSACKRLMLFLRWMVRSDAVDPGGWTSVSPAELVVPLDVHIHRIAGILGLRRRATPDLLAALEVTEALRAFDPADPVRFDFALSRTGIRSDYDLFRYFPY